MATRAQRFRSESERRHPSGAGKPKSSRRQPKKAAFGRNKRHAAAKATVALETTQAGRRPSRKSTRASANRAKSDVPFDISEQRRKTSPQARARKSLAKRATVRGSGVTV
jgi:hypothetical protein